MQAIILAAGMGKRLKTLTENNTKCMIKVNGVTLIERMLFQLDKLKLSRIVIVTGYKEIELKEYISTLNINTRIIYISNDKYYKTNNIYSLYLSRKYLLKEDTLLLESDLIFEDNVLERIIKDDYPSLALVSKYESWMDGTVVTIDENKNIKSFLDKEQFRFNDINNYYKTVNVYKFSKKFSNTYYVPFLEAYIKALGNNEYYEQVLKVVTIIDKSEIKASVLENESWYEIDDVQDLDIAESIFTNCMNEKLSKIQKRYGGYWRYPKLLDFCYLVNPFYPSSKLLDEMKANFERLICDYPSGIEVNTLLVSKYFDVDKNQIVVGNGAAEIIKSLMGMLNGKLGIITPTFEEYVNRVKEENIVIYDNSSYKNYCYSADDLIEFYNDKAINSLLLINPDNPSGNYIKKESVLKISNWALKKGINLIVDESFVDFVDIESSPSLIEKDIIEENPNLIIIKSISKSFGVPGLRLGILVTSNLDIIRNMKKDLSIWNINSFAEFYMQIFEKYRNDYTDSINKFKEVKKEYIEELSKIKNLRVIPTQANYIMCEILGSFKAKEITSLLLNNYNILIKDLSSKKGINGEYIRIAIKGPDENKYLIESMKKVLI